MPFFRRKSSTTKERKTSVEDAKASNVTADKPFVDVESDKGKAHVWAESVLKSIDTPEPKQAQKPPTPPSSPQYDTPTRVSMSRSRSQPQALPYHRPWNRHLASSQAGQEPDMSRSASASSTANGPISESNSWSRMAPGTPLNSNGNLVDFRVSPSAIIPPSPAQRKQVIDAARRVSLKKAKAPSEFNILVMGAKATGKTSWIRTLLSTLDVGHCSEEVKIAAAQLGVSSSSTHPSRRTDPIIPLSTKTIDCLSGIELQANSVLPLASFDSTASDNGRNMRSHSIGSNRGSIFSTSTSATTSKRLHFSICDTPGLDFDIEHEFETQRKVSNIVKYVESKLTKTLVEEGKIKRRNKSDDYVHLIIYFIDPIQMVEKCESRRREARRTRTSNNLSAEGRGRSNSESHAQGRPSFPKSRDSTTDVNGETGGEMEEDSSTEGLSPLELSIISKLTKCANVLPIIAKADTLTLTRLHEVRQAVRKSLKAAKIDLGTFNIDSSNSRRKQSTTNDDVLETLVAENQEPKEEVKLIRVRSRRSFSASGRVASASTAGHGEESEVGHSSLEAEALHSTDPLFPAGPENEEDPEAIEKAHHDLLKMIPLSIFVPDPIRRKVRAEDQDGQVQQSRVPPVPPLPRMPTNGTIESIDITRDSGGVSPITTDLSQPQIPKVPVASSRYERNYRWGTANVLDPNQCDFGLLRTTILGTHIDALKDSTSLRYEQFRSRRLELIGRLKQGAF